MAPTTLFVEPLMRVVRDLKSAFIALSWTTITTNPNTFSPSSTSSNGQISKRAGQILSIPATYALLDSSPEPGVVVGIVLGVVAGVVLTLIAIYQALGLGGRGESSVSGGGSVIVVEEEESSVGGRARRRGPARSRSARGGRGGRVVEEIVEVRERSHSGIRTVDEYSDDVVEVIEESSATPYDDVVEVEEEESSVATSPPRRKRTSGGGSYRRVDPLAYGGDDEPYRRPPRR